MIALATESYAVHTEVYDGPLEQLLYLIRRDGIDIRDITVSRVTDEYLGYLRAMKALDVDIAGEFLVLASELCALKSYELFPRVQATATEEEEDPRHRLIDRILQYERYRRAAMELDDREMLDRDVYARPEVEEDPMDRPIDPGVDAFGLLEAFYRVVEAQLNPPEEAVHDVAADNVSLHDQVAWLMKRLQFGTDATLQDVIGEVKGRPAKVVTFLALLELARLQIVNIVQMRFLGPVELTLRVEPEEADLSAIPLEA